MTEQEEIEWERNHPITNSLLATLARDMVRLSKKQQETIRQVVGKMEVETRESRDAQHKLRNHIIWHIEKNSKSTAIYQQNEKN